MGISGTSLGFVVLALALLAIFAPGLWADLRAAWLAIRAGARSERRDIEAGKLRQQRLGYDAVIRRDGRWVRPSPGHRNFGIPRASRDGVALPSWREDAPDAPAFMHSILGDVLQGEHPGLIGRHILGDH